MTQIHSDSMPSYAGHTNGGRGANSNNYLGAVIVLTSLFFMWGLITSLNDILIPHLKAVFTLSYVQAMLIQFCFFGAYLVMSFPSGYLTEKLGYRNSIITGLVVAGLGCLLFLPAAELKIYSLFLGALFVLASGIALLQVAANPYVAALGTPQTASSRLTLTQAFNSLGTTIGPALGSALILSQTVLSSSELNSLSPEQLAQHAATEASAVQMPYLVLAGVLFCIAIIFSFFKLPTVTEATVASDAPEEPAAYRRHSSVWGYRHLVLGAVGIFVYVGAEVSIGSLLANFMQLPHIGGLSLQTAGSYISFYWGGAMVGRFIGAYVLRRVKPGRVVAFNAGAAILLLIIGMSAGGHVAMWSMLAIGLCNSILFPTLFTLAIDGLGKHTGEGSGVLCMAIVGGAIVPVIQGFLADRIGLVPSFIVPLVCYIYIVYYGLKGHYADFETIADKIVAVKA